jgi:hypothetical protein
MELKIVASSLDDLRRQVHELAQAIGYREGPPPPLPIPQEQPKKRQPKKEKVEEPKTEEPAIVSQEKQTIELPATASKDEVLAALQDVSKVKGIETAKALLASFGYGRISELQGHQYAEFIAKCKASVG